MSSNETIHYKERALSINQRSVRRLRPRLQLAIADAHCVCWKLSASPVRHRHIYDRSVRGTCTEFGSGRLFAIPVNDPESSYEYPEQVRLELEQEDLSSYERAAEFLNFNGNDLVCLQHEYGIYGGIAGGHILTLLRKLNMPVVTTLHTVCGNRM